MFITDTPHYKLKVSISKSPVPAMPDCIHVTLQRWLPELDWIKTEMYLSGEEFDILKYIISTFKQDTE
jgi:hypothetical protein